MKRYLVAAGMGTMVFGAALGSAAGLGINDAGVVQVGQATDLSCDGDGVVIDGYTAEPEMYQGVAKSYNVTVSGIDGACGGKTLVASVIDANDNTIAHGYKVIPAGGGTMTVEWESSWGNNGKIDAANIEGVRLLIG